MLRQYSRWRLEKFVLNCLYVTTVLVCLILGGAAISTVILVVQKGIGAVC